MRLCIIIGLCLQFTSTALADESQKEIDKVYRTTKLSKADDENFTLLRGPKRSRKRGYGGSYWKLRSFKYPDKSDEHQMYIQFLGDSKSNHFITALLDNGDQLPTNNISGRRVGCSIEPRCPKNNAVIINLSASALLSYAKESKPLSILLTTKGGTQAIATVPVPYLKGYIKKAQDTLGLFKEGVS